MSDESSRLNIALKYGRHAKEVLFPRLDGLLPLVGNLVVAYAFNEHIHYVFHIAYNRNLGLYVLADFGGVDVDVNDGGVLAHLVRSGNGSVAESCSADDDKIRVVKRAVGNRLAVGAEHTEVQLVLAGHNADAHHGRDNGNSRHVGERLELGLYAREKHSSARNDQRTAALFDSLNRALYLNRVTLGVRLVADDVHAFGIDELLDLVFLYVHRNVDKHGAFSAG